MATTSPGAPEVERLLTGPSRTTLSVAGCPASYIVIDGETVEIMALHDPVQYGAGSAFLDPRAMKIGCPYPVELEGHTVVVVKRRSGALDFYAVPDE